MFGLSTTPPPPKKKLYQKISLKKYGDIRTLTRTSNTAGGHLDVVKLSAKTQ